MERLTKRRADTGDPCICTIEALNKSVERLAAYEDTELEPEEAKQLKLALMGKSIAEVEELDGIPIKHLQELSKAEKDGRLVALPCEDALRKEADNG